MYLYTILKLDLSPVSLQCPEADQALEQITYFDSLLPDREVFHISPGKTDRHPLVKNTKRWESFVTQKVQDPEFLSNAIANVNERLFEVYRPQEIYEPNRPFREPNLKLKPPSILKLNKNLTELVKILPLGFSDHHLIHDLYRLPSEWPQTLAGSDLTHDWKFRWKTKDRAAVVCLT